MTALACAREALLGPMDDRVVAYVSDQAHSSLARAARLLGFRPDQLRVLPAGEDLRLARAHAGRARSRPTSPPAARRCSRRSSAGATNTGAVDPLDELADVCRAHGVWLHVDAAYGGLRGADRARPRGAARDRARRLDRARPAQVALPADRVRRPARPRGPRCCGARSRSCRTTSRTPRSTSGEVNFSDLGPAAHARLARAEGLAVDPDARARRLPRRRSTARSTWPRSPRQRVRETPELELLSPGAARHRLLPPALRGVETRTSSRLNAALVRRARGDGRGVRLLDAAARRYAIRLCVLNHTSTAAGRRVGARLVRAAPRRRDRRRRRRSRARGARSPTCTRSRPVLAATRSARCRCSRRSRPSRPSASPAARASGRRRAGRASSSGATSSSATST